MKCVQLDTLSWKKGWLSLISFRRFKRLFRTKFFYQYIRFIFFRRSKRSYNNITFKITSIRGWNKYHQHEVINFFFEYSTEFSVCLSEEYSEFNYWNGPLSFQLWIILIHIESLSQWFCSKLFLMKYSYSDEFILFYQINLHKWKK